MTHSIIIIGAGISGLSAGCYAAMNGYEVRIVEAHSLPGGLCTSWKRKGYLIDDSCHMLMGTAPGNSYYQIWQELGAIQGRHIVNYESFAGVTALDGREFRLYADPDRLERHMKELSPADAVPSEEFCGYIRKFADFKIPAGKPAELMGFLDGMKMMIGILPFMKLFGELLSLTLDNFAARFKDPLLGERYPKRKLRCPRIALLHRHAARHDEPENRGISHWRLARVCQSHRDAFHGLGGTVHYGARSNQSAGAERAGNRRAAGEWNGNGSRLRDRGLRHEEHSHGSTGRKPDRSRTQGAPRIGHPHRSRHTDCHRCGPRSLGQPCCPVRNLPVAGTRLHRRKEVRVVQRQELCL